MDTWMFLVSLFVGISYVHFASSYFLHRREDNVKCSQTTKLKAMYSSFTFSHSLKAKPIIGVEVRVVWDEFKFYNGGAGGTYAAYTIGSNRRGPGGYFGDQMTNTRGQFLFSLWDGDRKVKNKGETVIKKSSRLTWPLDTDRCKRNCQDCGMSHLGGVKKAGYSTGTQCKIQYPHYTGGNGYTIKLTRTEERKTINTADYGGMPKSHEDFGETDRNVTGSSWKVEAINDNGEKFQVGEMLFEEATAVVRLGSFDEMLGCRKCDDIYHRDTRYGPKITYEDGTVETPISVRASAKSTSTCKMYRISGSKADSSIVFESGPDTENAWTELGKSLPVW